MHYFEFATADATLYEGEATQSVNTGLDPILEVRKDMNDTGTVINVSRALVKFDMSYISASVQNGLIPKSAKYYLNLYDAGSSDLPSSQTLYAYPVSQSWTMGDGTYHSNPQITEGCSWRYRHGEIDGTQWISGSNNTGGTWFSGSYANGTRNFTRSASLEYETTDIRMDVTDIAHAWIYSGSLYANEGFMVKRSGSVGNTDSGSGVQEGDGIQYGQLKFFSRDTSTIYPPKLEVEWDDHSWSTGSLEPLTGSALEDTVIYFKNLREEYKQNSKVRFRLVGRERYPKKTYSTTAAEVAVKYLPSGSQFIEHGTYYQVRDAVTDDVIIPYGTGSIVSCDTESNFFNIWMNGFQPERYYKFEIRVVTGSKSSQTQIVNEYDNEYVFKVSR
ncbi:hypothetical protein CMO86_00125 [Candidatus Woesearchaeota archaeon]|jgi:hypothetical protein|nr:hypothetical protein [Candidatus Woesearchaeota archaeon]|tara:strand:- start:648 stop:1811 length:1164 start_codon:yes stop_codon:yes gene_type:complete